MDTEKPMLDDEHGVQVSNKSKQYIAVICVSLGALCAGTVLAWTSPVLPQLKLVLNKTEIQNTTAIYNVSESFTGTETYNDTETTNPTNIFTVTQTPSISQNEDPESSFRLTETEAGLVGSMLAVGALISALPGGYLADKYGRKKVNLALSVPFLLNYILIVFAKGPVLLYFGRFFAGIATGAICVTAPMYIGEVAEVSIRGTLGSFFQMFLVVGIFLTYLIGAFTNWVALSAILGIFPIAFAVSFYFMPETPVYLVKSGDIKEAEKVLKYFRGENYNVTGELKMIQDGIASAAGKSASLKDLVSSRANKKALISAFALMTFQQLSGINAVIFYTVDIFKSAGSTLSPDVAAIIVAIVQVIIAYVAASVIEKANRRIFLMISSAGMMICLAALGLFFHLKAMNVTSAALGILPVSSLVAFIIAFSLGYGPVPWMIMSELFAPEIKGIASGLTVVCNWLLVFFVTFCFPLMTKNLGESITFYIFAIVMGVATTFVFMFLPETRGKTIQEIQAILSK